MYRKPPQKPSQTQQQGNRHRDPGHLHGEHPRGWVTTPWCVLEDMQRKAARRRCRFLAEWPRTRTGQHQTLAGHGAAGPLACGCWKRGKALPHREGHVVSSKTSHVPTMRSSGRTPWHLPQMTTWVHMTPAHGCPLWHYPQLPKLRHHLGALESGTDAQAVGHVDGGR